jgi:hypothetical protein
MLVHHRARYAHRVISRVPLVPSHAHHALLDPSPISPVNVDVNHAHSVDIWHHRVIQCVMIVLLVHMPVAQVYLPVCSVSLVDLLSAMDRYRVSIVVLVVYRLPMVRQAVCHVIPVHSCPALVNHDASNVHPDHSPIAVQHNHAYNVNPVIIRIPRRPLYARIAHLDHFNRQSANRHVYHAPLVNSPMIHHNYNVLHVHNHIMSIHLVHQCACNAHQDHSIPILDDHHVRYVDPVHTLPTMHHRNALHVHVVLHSPAMVKHDALNVSLDSSLPIPDNHNAHHACLVHLVMSPVALHAIHANRVHHNRVPLNRHVSHVIPVSINQHRHNHHVSHAHKVNIRM